VAEFAERTTTVVHSVYNGYMAATTKPSSKVPKARALRQSVSIPAPLAIEVRRVARERHLTVSRALVTLAERGILAEREAKENLRVTYRRFLKEQEPARKDEAGRQLIRAIFGNDAIAEDPIL
jgi:hypothetical protein